MNAGKINIRARAVAVRLLGIAILAFPLLLHADLVAPRDSSLQDAQRNAIDGILAAADVLRSDATGLARSPDMGLGRLQPEFRAFLREYEQFKTLLTPQQQSYATLELADLDAGTEIIAQLFPNQQQLASVGTLTRSDALQRARILSEAVSVWCNKLQTDVRRRLQIW